MPEQFCFVVMGYGKKVDYSKEPRTLDLDRTYYAIIKPAVEAAGLRCIRSDEVLQSGVIDQRMYEMLLRAALVIADISTANPNAIYELGIRHALKPYATIVMKEQDGTFYFDLNHIATFPYKHLGEDIGYSEALAKAPALTKLIREVLARPVTDSPVYTFLKTLKQPIMTEIELGDAVRAAEVAGKDGWSAEIAAGAAAARDSKHGVARDAFQRAHDLQSLAGGSECVDPFVVQQLALHTYKAKQPDALAALEAGRQIIERLRPETSTDPETLGIAGAIRKRLAQAAGGGGAHLDAAIELYGRGFAVKNDYYNGENYALCLDLRSAQQTDPSEAGYDRMTARKVRQRVMRSVKEALAAPTARERPDFHWMVATAANVAYALGDADAGAEYELLFTSLGRAKWEVETFTQGKSYALTVPRG